jgi:hypothetical protein
MNENAEVDASTVAAHTARNRSERKRAVLLSFNLSRFCTGHTALGFRE